MRRYMQNIHIHVSTLIYIVNSVTQWHPEGLVVWTIARQVSANDSEKLFSDPKALRQKASHPLAKTQTYWQQPEGIQEYPPLSQREQSPAPVQKTGPRAQAVHWGARLYLAGNTTSCTSSGSFPPERWPSTSQQPYSIAGDWTAGLHPWLLPNTHIYYWIMKVILRTTFSNNIHNSLFSPLITLQY